MSYRCAFFGSLVLSSTLFACQPAPPVVTVQVKAVVYQPVSYAATQQAEEPEEELGMDAACSLMANGIFVPDDKAACPQQGEPVIELPVKPQAVESLDGLI